MIYEIADHRKFKECDELTKLMAQKGRDSFKTHYKNAIDSLFRKKFTLLGMYGPCTDKPNNPIGVLTRKSKFWHDYNRFNTHPKICRFVAAQALKKNRNFFINLGDPVYNEQNAHRLVSFLEENFDLFFTNKFTNLYVNAIASMLVESWVMGNITMIQVLIVLVKLYPNYKSIEFDFDTGNLIDMVDGVDIKLVLNDGTVLTFQVKSGSLSDKKYYNDSVYFLNGSQNDLNYPNCTHYIYGSVKNSQYPNQRTEVAIIKNDTSKITKNEKGSIMVPVECVENIIKENMALPENLTKLLEVCSKNTIIFVIQNKETENTVKLVDEENEDGIMEKRLIINFADPKDNSLNDKILEMIDELEKLS